MPQYYVHTVRVVDLEQTFNELERRHGSVRQPVVVYIDIERVLVIWYGHPAWSRAESILYAPDPDPGPI